MEKKNFLSKIPVLKDMKPEQLKKIGLLVAAAVAVAVVFALIISVAVSGSGAKGALKKYFKSA